MSSTPPRRRDARGLLVHGQTDGRLPTGDTLADAIGAVDQATDPYASYFMVNCAPSPLPSILDTDADWTNHEHIDAISAACVLG